MAKITGKEGLEFTGKARTFDTEDAFVEAVEKGEIKKGEKTVVVLRYLGPKGGPGESISHELSFFDSACCSHGLEIVEFLGACDISVSFPDSLPLFGDFRFTATPFVPVVSSTEHTPASLPNRSLGGREGVRYSLHLRRIESLFCWKASWFSVFHDTVISIQNNENMWIPMREIPDLVAAVRPEAC